MAPKSSDLYSAVLKLKWAERKINSLESDINTFISKKPYKINKYSIHNEPGLSVKRIFTIELTEHVPELIPIEIGSILETMRSSLDYLVVNLAIRNGSKNNRDVQFPICRSEQDFLSVGSQRKISKLRQEDIDTIKSLKPYHGGNESIYLLNEMTNKTKHRDLIAIAGPIKDIKFVGNGYFDDIFIQSPTNPFIPGTGFIQVTSSPGLDFEVDIFKSLAFAEPQISDRTVISTLREFYLSVEAIVRRFEI